MQRKNLLIFEEVNEHNMRDKIEIYEEFHNYRVKLNKNYYCIAGNENERVIKKTSNANMMKVKIHDL